MRPFLALTFAACGASTPAPTGRPPAMPERVEITVIPHDSWLGRTVALLPDGRGLAPDGDSLAVVDPKTGSRVGSHPAKLPPAPQYGCQPRRWGNTPAIVCDADDVYRLDGGEWKHAFHAETEHSDVLIFSDDGQHAAYSVLRCPNEAPVADTSLGKPSAICMFGPNGWRRVDVMAAELVAVRGKTVTVIEHDRERTTAQLRTFDADTGAAGPVRPVPLWRDQKVYWTRLFIADNGELPDGLLVLHASSLAKGMEATGPGAAGLIAIERADGTFDVRETTDAPRERWGVRVAFADPRHAVAAGSFYRNIYYTVDAGAHWTAVAGQDPQRDAQFRQGRLMEDSAVQVRCDPTHTCRIHVDRDLDLAIRFP